VERARSAARPGERLAGRHGARARAKAGKGDRLAGLAGAQNGFAADLVAPVARAWGHIAAQDWQAAHDALHPVMADHARFGGSRAQRDLLELSWANILVRLGRTDAARTALATRRPVLAAQPPISGL